MADKGGQSCLPLQSVRQCGNGAKLFRTDLAKGEERDKEKKRSGRFSNQGGREWDCELRRPRKGSRIVSWL